MGVAVEPNRHSHFWVAGWGPLARAGGCYVCEASSLGTVVLVPGGWLYAAFLVLECGIAHALSTSQFNGACETRSSIA